MELLRLVRRINEVISKTAVAVSFAEAGEVETARHIMGTDHKTDTKKGTELGTAKIVLKGAVNPAN